MRSLTAALMLVSAMSFAHAGEPLTTKSQETAQPAATQVQPADQTKAQLPARSKSNALGKAGREGCGHMAQTKAPLLTN